MTSKNKVFGILLLACVLIATLGCVAYTEPDARQQLIAKCHENNIAIDEGSIVFLNPPTPTPWIHSPGEQYFGSIGTTFSFSFNTTDGKPHNAEVFFSGLGLQNMPGGSGIQVRID
jgi:hypothetical protein